MQRLKLIIGHFLHAVVLLLPALMFVRDLNSSPLVAFALTIIAAGVLESHSVVCEPSVSRARDQTAILVARVVGVLLLALFWSAQIEFLIRGNPPVVLFSIGMVLAIVGVYLRIATIRALGKHFNSDIAIAGEVVDSGVFRWMRHPSEVGMLLFTIGVATALGAVYCALVAAVVMIPISIWRMRREDNLIRPLLAARDT